VVSHKGGEHSKLEPPGAELFGRVAAEPADIGPHHLQAPEVGLNIVSDGQL
jgi:hypothetical protein